MLLATSAARPAVPSFTGRAESSSSFFNARSALLPRRAHQGRQSYRQTTTCGLPIIGAVVNPFTVTVAWAAGAFKFYTGYDKTPFENDSSKKATLTALWPVLYATNADFRKHFQKAISSSDQ